MNSKSCKLNNTRPSFALIALAASLVVLSSCASAPPPDRSQVCAAKFQKAEEHHNKKQWWKSQEPLQEIVRDCHGTGFMERSQFMLAESYFHLEDWIEARGEYSTFVLNFPSSPFAETAAFRKALSSYRTSYSDMRDDSPTELAMRDFQEFTGNFPNSALADSALLYQDSLVNRLGEKEFQTARLYWRMKEPLAAAIYLKAFLVNYPHNKRQFEALQMIIDSYIILEQFEQAQLYLDEMSKAFPQAQSEHKGRVADLASARERFEARILKDRRLKQYKKEDAL